MSNVKDINDFKTVEQLNTEVIHLKRENHAALITIDKLLKDLSQKTEQIKHLENLVSQNVPTIKKEAGKLTLQIDAATEIAELQLERLRQSANARTLTLEETRMFDLLVKNKRLAQDESTINLNKNQYRDVKDADLLQIAAAEVKPSDDSND